MPPLPDVTALSEPRIGVSFASRGNPPGQPAASVGPGPGPAVERGESLSRVMIEAHYDFIWRLVRRMGIDPAHAEDIAQQVFILAMRKVASILPGSERAFLYGITVRAVSDFRRTASFRREVCDLSESAQAKLVSADPLPDEALARKQGRALLDRVLGSLPFDLRTVFVLFELEELTMAEIATVLELPHGGRWCIGT